MSLPCSAHAADAHSAAANSDRPIARAEAHCRRLTRLRVLPHYRKAKTNQTARQCVERVSPRNPRAFACTSPEPPPRYCKVTHKSNALREIESCGPSDIRKTCAALPTAIELKFVESTPIRRRGIKVCDFSFLFTASPCMFERLPSIYPLNSASRLLIAPSALSAAWRALTAST